MTNRPTDEELDKFADTMKEFEEWKKGSGRWRDGTSNGLKPCPFCGGDVELRDMMDGRDETYAIHCNKCHMHFEKFVWRGYDKSTVVKEWNRRAKE